MPGRALLLIALIVLGAISPIIVLNAGASGATLRVPTDFSTIQGAIDAATPGDTILVLSGTYNERIIVNKTLTILGQSSDTTTISGDNLGTVVNITSAGVSWGNFTIKNSGSGQDASGVCLFLVSECRVYGNNITNNGIGILVSNASGNTVFHNNFVDNAVHVVTSNSTNSWDSGYPSGGNYWSDFTGIDAKRGPLQDHPGSDGIMDLPFHIDESNVDNYPFASYWRPRTVKNLQTGLSYSSIQEAIDAAETVGGNTIRVYSGVFYENLKVRKSVHLVGENTSVSIVDGGGVENVVEVSSDGASIEGLTLRNSGGGRSNSAVFVNGVSSVMVNGAALTNSSVGLFLSYSSDCVIRNNIIANDAIGMDLSNSQGNIMQSNNITSQSNVGLLLQYSNSNVVDQNVFQSLRDGVRVESSSANEITRNIVAQVASYAVRFSSSERNLFSGNKVIRGYVGLWIEDGSENMIGGNEISYNTMGANLASSSNNTIYFNNFVENVFQVEIDAFSGTNNWNMSYPLGGNFWKSSAPGGSYTGVDVKSGPYQNETGSDGIGDTPFVPYSTNLENKDYYPQMQAVSLTAAVDVHDVGLKGIFVPSDRIYRGGVLNVTVLVSNLGNYTETFSVTAYYGASPIASRGVSGLLPSSDLNLTFVWNVAGVTAGTYLISANATVVPGEDSLQNNQFVGGKVTVIFYRDVAVSSAVVSSTVAFPSGTVNITALVSNLGEVSENVTVRAAYDENLIGSRTINGLTAHANVSVTFSWKASGVVTCRSYNVTVKVDPVPDEAVLGNNVLQAGRINVRIVGDLNGDGVVDILDITVIAVRFNSRIGDPKYDLLFDLDSDGVINIIDIALAARNFMRTCQ